MSMKVIAIDDEPVALSIIREYCQRLGDMDLSLYSDPVVGMDAVVREKPELVFLDIEMNGVSGIDIAARLPAGTYLVFTTAYARFAVDGFELNATDFLHKPFSFARFSTAVGKVREMIRLRSAAVKNARDEGEITVKSEYKNVNIPLSDILYVEAMDNYVKIHLPGRDPVLSQISMKEMTEILPQESFLRVHRSFIVPIRRVAAYTRKQVELSYMSLTIPVGRVYADDFIAAMSRSGLSF